MSGKTNGIVASVALGLFGAWIALSSSSYLWLGFGGLMLLAGIVSLVGALSTKE